MNQHTLRGVPIAPGDTVHVRAKVTHITVPGVIPGIAVVVKSDLCETQIILEPSDIVHVEPRALAVGDAVRLKGHTHGAGAILAIGAEYAWVSFPTYAPQTRKLADLVRA